jgi:hypothetical protein
MLKITRVMSGRLSCIPKKMGLRGIEWVNLGRGRQENL